MLKFLLIFFIVIYLVGYLGKFFLGRWIKKVTGQAQKQNDFVQKPEGEVTVNTKAANSQKSRFDDGDYVDYEEIKD